MTFSSSLAQRGWKECLFSEFVEIAPQVKLNNGSVYSFIEMADLSENSKYCVSKETRTFNGSGTRFEEKDTLFARITPCLENGKICQVRGLLNNKAFGSTEFHVFRGKTGISDTDFVFYLSRWNEVRDFAEANLHGTSGRQRVPKESFDNLLLNLPSLPEQRAIAGVLSSLDDKIDLLHRQNKTLEGIAESLWRKMFVEDADPKWKKGRLGDYVRIQGGFAFKSRDFKETGGIGIIKITNIADGQVDIVNTQFVDTVIVKNLDPNLKLLQGAVLIAMTGAEIGKIGIVENTEKELWLNQRVGIFNEIRRYGKLLAFFALNSDEGQEHILSSATGSAQPNISSTKIEEFEIPILPDLVLNEFGVIVNPLVDKICFNLGQVRTLSNLRDTLLPKLMSGEVMLKHE